MSHYEKERKIFLCLNQEMSGAPPFSMKSAQLDRVNVGAAPAAFTQGLSIGGNPRMCVASPDLHYDQFGRYVGGIPRNTLRFRDPGCSPYVYSAREKILHENEVRPSIPITGRDRRYKPVDLMAAGRNQQPVNLYEHDMYAVPQRSFNDHQGRNLPPGRRPATMPAKLKPYSTHNVDHGDMIHEPLHL
jgi:hypothetical protein